MRRRNAPTKPIKSSPTSGQPNSSPTSTNSQNFNDFSTLESDEDVYDPNDELASPAYGFRKLNNGRKKRTKTNKHNEQSNQNIRRKPLKPTKKPTRQHKQSRPMPNKPSRSPTPKRLQKSTKPNPRPKRSKLKNADDEEQEGTNILISYLYDNSKYKRFCHKQ